MGGGAVNGIWRELLGTVRAEIRCPEPEQLLERCRREGLRLWQLRPLDACTLRLSLWERDLLLLRRRTEESGAELTVLRLRGGSRSRRLLRARRALLLSLLLAAALLLGSSLFVWELEVRGCERLSPGTVLRALADCGVEPGSFRPGISADLLRSRMLTRLPELEWMTVNFSGSRGTVLIRERKEKPEIFDPGKPAEIRATRAGIVRSVTVLQGRGTVRPGDAVSEGELLISAVRKRMGEPAGLQRALGEVRAETWYELSAVCPLEMLRSCEKGSGEQRFSLQIGKKRLGGGTIPGKGLDECDKIVHEYTLGAEGLFTLPLRLIRTERHPLLPDGGTVSREEEMKSALLRRLEERIDGEVLDCGFFTARSGGLLIVTLRARCCENIAGTVELAGTVP